MQYQTFTDPPAFIDRVQGMLERHEALNSVFLSIIARLVSGRPIAGSAAAPLMCLVADGRSILAAAVRTPPHNLVLGHSDHAIGIAVMADALARQRVELPGIYAPRETAAVFIRAWSKLSSQRITPGLVTRVYQATRLNPPSGVEGAMRLAQAHEYDMLLAWAEAFAHEAHLTGPRPSAFMQLAMEESRLYVWEPPGGPVSMAICGLPTPTGTRINSVYTPPEMRQRGYASALVAALAQKLLDSGRRFASLNADVSNSVSNGVYRRVGFEAVGDACEYHFVPAID